MEDKYIKKVIQVQSMLHKRGIFYLEFSNGHLKVDKVNLRITTEKWYDEERGVRGQGINSFMKHLKDNEIIWELIPMIVKWREKEYTFNVRTLEAGKDKEGKGAKVTVDKNIYAFDTESVVLPDRYEPMCFQISSPIDGEKLVYFKEREKALEKFIEFFIQRYSYLEFKNHYCFMYGHNLVYDWLQLIKHYPDLIAIARTGIGLKEDYEIYKTDEYTVTLRKNGLFTGTAPHFTINVKFSKREWVDIMFRDTFSFFPSSLKKLSKDLGLEEEKMDRQEDIGKRDYRKEGDSEDKQYFEKYSKVDALCTRLVGERIRELHKHAEMQRIRVSAPGFAINYLYHILPEGFQIVNGVNDEEIMQLILDTYAGGRTGGVYHGKVENLTVIDFHSSYPASMVSLPSFTQTMEYFNIPNPENIPLEELMEIIEETHCFMDIDGEETDMTYPSLIQSTKGKLYPVRGKFKNIKTTGVEACVGLKEGTLKIERLNKLVVLIETKEPFKYPFREFAESAYDRKKTSENGSSEYTSAKLVLNASYGKLIESRSETPIAENVRNIVLPVVPGMETEFGHMYYKKYIDSLNVDSEETFEELYPSIVDEILNNFEDVEMDYKNFEKLSLTKLEYGRYVIPAAASLITGTSRARLSALNKCTRSIYWDTDSSFIRNFNPNTISKTLAYGTSLLPGFVIPLTIGDNLGELGIEIENASGYLAGTKRYYLHNDIHRNCEDRSNCKECQYKKKCKVKQALHGIPTAPYDQAENMIKNLATGSEYKYKGRERPTGVKETKDINEIGKFKSKEYAAQFHLDNRLDWIETPGGWIGTVKEFDKLRGGK